MTGATIFIKSGDSVLMGKVRHDGQDVAEFFTPERVRDFSGTPQELWAAYLKWRRGDMSDVSKGSEIETAYDGGFVFEIPEGINLQISCRPLLELADKELEKVAPDDGYLCGYEDLEALVDLDAHVLRLASWMDDEEDEDEDKDEDDDSEPGGFPEDDPPELDDQTKAYAQFRQCVRDILSQKGVPSNPGWSDSDICEALAKVTGCKVRGPLDAK